ncbi:MAG TPA: acetyl-CoA C-acetyltransferase [Clostridiales bacterium UBA8153]|nr:acetyl-CoA C-acetyltransferase [Clostridiales bacterium UBA8153]
MSETVIVSACRTPFGGFGGALKDIPAAKLGGLVIAEAVKRAGIPPASVEQVCMGMVVQAGAGQVPSRQATLAAGLPLEVPSDTINKVCASSLRAVNLADALIRAQDAHIVVAGGMENMSQGPYLLTGGRFGYRLGHSTVLDATVHDGLWCPVKNAHMGNHGNAMGRKFGFSREQQDAWAYRSHRLAIAAIDAGYFDPELVPVEIAQRKGPPVRVSVDEGPRRDTSPEKLAALRPAFDPAGTVTAGNAPSINDGACALVLMSRAKAEELGVRPLATIVSQGMVSSEAEDLGTVPALSAQKAMKKAGLSFGDMDLVEINEAFATVALTSIQLAGLDPDRVNVNGGAIALGHPIGASGGRILMTLIYELRRRGLRYGVAAICSGGGQGEATVVRVE